MNILVETNNGDGNWGDFTMLDVTLRRMREHFGSPTFILLDALPASIDRDGLCLTTINKEGEMLWRSQRALWSKFDRYMPGAVDRAYAAMPGILETLVTRKAQLLGYNEPSMSAFLKTFDEADLLVIAGGGFITDLFVSAEPALNLIHLAKTRELPVALVGQGIGPIRSERLWKKAQRTLPLADLIATRERRTSPALLQDVGVASERIRVTGDDAIEPAYEARPERLGTAIGVNVRIATYSNTTRVHARTVAETLGGLAREKGVDLAPVPIAFKGKDSDVDTLKRLFAMLGRESDGGASLRTLAQLLEQIARCRVVVTGAYHAGVFALSQGIPVVALSCSEYYDSKFLGLAHQFGTGCRVLRVDRSDFAEALGRATAAAWKEAPKVRSALLSAARRQIAASRQAYESLAELVASASQSETQSEVAQDGVEPIQAMNAHEC